MKTAHTIRIYRKNNATYDPKQELENRISETLDELDKGLAGLETFAKGILAESIHEMGGNPKYAFPLSVWFVWIACEIIGISIIIELVGRLM